MIILLAGAAVIYKTRYQKAVALSSTEAEFVAASETGKMIIYLRSLLHDLGHSTADPTVLNVDNSGATFMIAAQAPTKRTRHIDIQYFALFYWAATNQLVPQPIKTDANISDAMTKPLGRIKFHQQADLFMGRTRPLYICAHQHRLVMAHWITATFLHRPRHDALPLAPMHRDCFALTYPFFAALFQLTDMQDHGGGERIQ